MPMLPVLTITIILVDVGLKRIQQAFMSPGHQALLEIAGREAASLKRKIWGLYWAPY